jgi:hypothetical protein
MAFILRLSVQQRPTTAVTPPINDPQVRASRKNPPQQVMLQFMTQHAPDGRLDIGCRLHSAETTRPGILIHTTAQYKLMI